MNAPGGETSEADLDVRRRRALLLVVAAVIAGAGVAYELGLMLLGTVTVGSTERANAVVLGDRTRLREPSAKPRAAWARCACSNVRDRRRRFL